ncbi:class I SAM-dependent methyltransferase [Sphaerisporangium sp. B11E5]|uniref:class I SAM-dependent methyltransferase n=1 Tax=Sphaerisporangium sp. B11E5 TaxID=3153563 RepID=UPI00325E82F5
MHRTFFRALSLLTPGRQGALLRRYFDWWHRRPDPWNLGTDGYERHKYATTLGRLPARPYRRILEVGCAEGVFTELLMAAHPGAEITGIDISERALDRARSRIGDVPRVRFEQADILEHRAPHGFDLVVCAETLYYIGRDDRLRQASARLCGMLAPGGLLVLVHPWPESRRLHRHVGADLTVTPLTEHVDTGTHRPFSVALYQAGPLDSAAGLSA